MFTAQLTIKLLIRLTSEQPVTSRIQRKNFSTPIRQDTRETVGGRSKGRKNGEEKG